MITQRLLGKDAGLLRLVTGVDSCATGGCGTLARSTTGCCRFPFAERRLVSVEAQEGQGEPGTEILEQTLESSYNGAAGAVERTCLQRFPPSTIFNLINEERR
jgi:hypothetical protein